MQLCYVVSSGFGTVGHLETDGRAVAERRPVEERPFEELTVEGHAADLPVDRRVSGGVDDDCLPVFEVHGGLAEERRTDGVLIRRGTYRIESQGREYVPRRGLAVVLIAAIAVGLRGVELVHHLALRYFVGFLIILLRCFARREQKWQDDGGKSRKYCFFHDLLV